MDLDLRTTFNRTIINFKKFGFKHLMVLGRYNYTRSEKELSEHIHKGMLEICYYDKGSQIFEVENVKHLVKGGDVFIHYPGEKHGSGGYPEEKGQLYWIIISLPRKVNDLYNDSRDLAFLCNKLIAFNKRHFKGSKSLKKILEEVFTTFEKKENKNIKHIRINVLLNLFLLELLDCADQNNKVTDDARLNKILTYIDNNVANRINISSLAKEINLSDSRFKSLFKELTGFTPGDYIQRKRVEKAVDVIRQNPQVSLTALAYELDFSSPQYFSSVIKKYVGKSPEVLKKAK